MLIIEFIHINGLLTVDFVVNKTKGRISKRVLQEKKSRQIFQKTNISYPLVRTRTQVCVSGGKKCSFFIKFLVCFLCFLVTLFLRLTLLPYYRRLVVLHNVFLELVSDGQQCKVKKIISLCHFSSVALF